MFAIKYRGTTFSPKSVNLVLFMMGVERVGVRETT